MAAKEPIYSYHLACLHIFGDTIGDVLEAKRDYFERHAEFDKVKEDERWEKLSSVTLQATGAFYLSDCFVSFRPTEDFCFNVNPRAYPTFRRRALEARRHARGPLYRIALDEPNIAVVPERVVAGFEALPWQWYDKQMEREFVKQENRIDAIHGLVRIAPPTLPKGVSCHKEVYSFLKRVLCDERMKKE